jgi:hypothetical protein
MRVPRFAYFAKGGYDDGIHNGRLERTRVAPAASPPTLAKNARMEHPPWEWCNAKMGQPPHLKPNRNQVREKVEAIWK